MGSAQSARKLTISNDQEVGVIQVSNAIVQRLTKGAEQYSEAPAPVQTVPSSSKPLPPRPQSDEALSGYPVFYYPELTLTALEIQKQKEKELRNQDLYWQRRFENMERSHKKIENILENEYKRALNEVSSTRGGKSLSIQTAAQPCLENSEKVLKCYQDHPRETLKCSNLVEEFSNCVDQRRAHMIAAR